MVNQYDLNNMNVYIFSQRPKPDNVVSVDKCNMSFKDNKLHISKMLSKSRIDDFQAQYF